MASESSTVDKLMMFIEKILKRFVLLSLFIEVLCLHSAIAQLAAHGVQTPEHGNTIPLSNGLAGNNTSSVGYRIKWMRPLSDEGCSTFFSADRVGKNQICAIGTKRHENGEIGQGLLVRIDLDGNLLQNTAIPAGSVVNVQPFSLFPMESGGFITVGWAQQQNKKQYTDGWIARYSDSGDLIWSSTFGGAKSDRLSGVTQLNSGMVVAVGRSQSKSSENWDGWAICVDLDGNTLWERYYGGTSDEGAVSVIAMPGGGFSFCGWKMPNESAKDDAWIVRCDSKGGAIWETQWGDAGTQVAYHLVTLNNKNLVVVGYASQNNGEANDGLILCINETGTIMWHKQVGADLDDRLNAVITTKDQQVIAAGSKSKIGENQYDGWLVHIDLMDMKIDQQVIGSLGQDRFFDIRMVSGHEVIIAGNSSADNALNEKANLVFADIRNLLPFSSIDPHDSELWLKLGHRLYKKEAYTSAIEAYTRIIDDNSTSSEACYYRGRCWEAQKEFRKAISDYEQALSRDPYNNDAYNARLILLRSGKSDPPSVAFKTPKVTKASLAGINAKMAFVNDGHIHIVDDEQIITNTQISGEDPSLAIDGDKLAYTRTMLIKHTETEEVDSTGTINVTKKNGINFLDLKTGQYGEITKRGQSPSFSPAGHYISLIKGHKVFILRTATGAQWSIGHGFNPVWQEHNELVYQKWGQVYHYNPLTSPPSPMLDQDPGYILEFGMLSTMIEDQPLSFSGKNHLGRVLFQTGLCSVSPGGKTVAYIQREMKLSDSNHGQIQTSIILIDKDRKTRRYDLSNVLHIDNLEVHAFAVSPDRNIAALAFGPSPEGIDRKYPMAETIEVSALRLIPLSDQSLKEDMVNANSIPIEDDQVIVDLDFWDNHTLYVTCIDKSRTIIRKNDSSIISVGMKDLTPEALEKMGLDASIADADKIYRIKLNDTIKGSELSYFYSGHGVNILPLHQGSD